MIPFADIAAELDREMAARRATYPRLVAALKMSADQEQAGYALCEAWRLDCARYSAHLAQPRPIAPLTPQHRQNGFTWHERRDGITRELEQRARLYPKWIDSLRLDAAEAARRTARLSAMLDLYDQGHDWHDSFGTPRPPLSRFDAPDRTQAENHAIAQWWHHVQTTLAFRHGGQQQEQLAL